jgi:hypothetical protein
MLSDARQFSFRCWCRGLRPGLAPVRSQRGVAPRIAALVPHGAW